jgi:tetratricopeptide (TPR) repeat protein
MSDGYRIRRDRSALADGTLFGRRKRGIARWKVISWLLAMGFVGLVVLQFNRVQTYVLAAVGQAPTPTPSASVYAQRGYAAYLAGDLESAIDSYCRASGGTPTKPFAEPRCVAPAPGSEAGKRTNLDVGYELIRVLIYRSFDDRRISTLYPKDAEAWGRVLVDAYPKVARARSIFAYALTYNDKAELAVPEGLNAVSLDPNDGEAFAFLSQANYFSNRFTNALTFGEQSVGLKPDSVDTRIAYAKALFQTGSFRAAEEQYKAALGVNPRLTFPYFELAGFYLYRANQLNAPPGMQDAAVAMYDEVLKLDNKNVKAYTRKCTAYFNQGDLTRALENCKNATGLDPDYTEAWKWQGQVWYNKRDYEDAIVAFQTCQTQERQALVNNRITREEQLPECWYLQGLAEYLLGKCENAYPLFNEVLSFTNNEQAINLTRRGIAGCASKDPSYATPTPIPTATPRPEPIR